MCEKRAREVDEKTRLDGQCGMPDGRDDMPISSGSVKSLRWSGQWKHVETIASAASEKGGP